MTYPLRIIATMALLAGLCVGFIYVIDQHLEVLLVACGVGILAVMAFLIVGPKNKREE